jgi:hypothetical protein
MSKTYTKFYVSQNTFILYLVLTSFKTIVFFVILNLWFYSFPFDSCDRVGAQCVRNRGVKFNTFRNAHFKINCLHSALEALHVRLKNTELLAKEA